MPPHPLFLRFKPFRGHVAPGFEAWHFGVMVRDWLFTGSSKNLPGGMVSVGYPPVNNEYFKWIGLMAAVVSAPAKFTMVELGAGWGRWLVAAAKLASQRGVPFTLAGVEADPDHFRWMQEVFQGNGLNSAEHTLACVAAACGGGKALFLRCAHPESNYGQRLIRPKEARVWKKQPGYRVVEVPATTLDEILTPFDRVDFLAIDVPGIEAEILTCRTQVLQKVRVLQTNTNSAQADERIATLLHDRGWANVFRFPVQAEIETVYGLVKFDQGLQTWVSPEATQVQELIESNPALAWVHGHEGRGSGRVWTKEAALRDAAKAAIFPRPLTPYPGWHFDIDWDQPDMALQERRSIWEAFRAAGDPGPLEIEWHHSIRLSIYLGNDLSKQLFVAGCYEPNEFAFLERFLAAGMRFVDCGANEGVYALFAAQRVGEGGRVYAFEPSPRELARLRHNVSLNHFPQVETFPFALSSTNGRSVFSIAEEEHAGQNSLGTPEKTVGVACTQEVATRKLDDVAEEEQWDRVDLMKIDVEGEEIRVIEGAARVLETMRPVILFECSAEALEHRGGSREKLLGLLRSFKYEIYYFNEALGLPTPAPPGRYSDNMIGAPMERLLQTRRQ